MSNKPTRPQEIVDAALARSAVDSEFRQLLLSDPRAAAAQVTDAPIPSNLKISFVEKPEDTDVLYVLPDFIPGADELSEAELEAVAGGMEAENSLECTVCTWTCGITW